MNGIEPKPASTARFVVAGAIVFAATGALFGWVWTQSELPFVMALQWAAGAGLLGWLAAGRVLATRQALAGGAVYLVSFAAVVFAGLVVDVPVPIALASGATGAVMGWLVYGVRGARVVGVAAFAGFVLGEALLLSLARIAPDVASDPGLWQGLWFALGQGALGVVGGAGTGYGFGRAVVARDAASVAARRR